VTDDDRATPGATGEPAAAASEPAVADPAAPLTEADHAATSQIVQSLTGSFLLISLKRAFRLEINPHEVLESERRALAASAAHVTDPEHQAFLAWRRSVLLIVAIAFVPLTVLRFLEAFDGPPVPDGARAAMLMPAFAEALFCLTAFAMLGKWTQWAMQRRVLLVAWALYFVAPFLLYLYPFQEAFDSTKELKAAAQFGELHLSAKKKHIHMAVGLVFGVKAMLALAPKAISLMPGVIRASIVSKLLFPGTAGPGFLMILAAPLYALFAYVIILLPYQITGSVYFVVGVLGVMTAQIFIALSGRKLTMPLGRVDARYRIHRYWLAYIVLLVGSAVVMLIGVADFVRKLDFSMFTVGTTILSFMSNVLVLTLIGTDAIIANLHRLAERRAYDEAHEALRLESEAKLRRFCG
jgi:hypothetical protein